jgi:hypothetical protein
MYHHYISEKKNSPRAALYKLKSNTQAVCTVHLPTGFLCLVIRKHLFVLFKPLILWVDCMMCLKWHIFCRGNNK